MYKKNLSFGIVLAALLPGTVSASTYTGGTWSSAGANDGYLEVWGVGVEDYSTTGDGTLTYCIDEALAWKGYMVGAGYSGYKVYTNTSATSRYYEEANYDDSYNDAADFSLFAGHGSSGAFYFASTSYYSVTGSETNWGEMDEVAVAMSSCQTLSSAGRSSFGTANKNDGVHYIFGYSSDMLDNDITGTKYGLYLASGYTLKAAWIQATKDSQSAAYTAAYVRFYSASCDTSADNALSCSCDPTSGSSYATSTWTL